VNEPAPFLIQRVRACADAGECNLEIRDALLSFLQGISLAAISFLLVENIAHAGLLVLYGQRSHPCIADATLAGQAVGWRRSTHYLTGYLQEALLLLSGVIGRFGHFVEDLLEVHRWIGLQRCEQRGCEWRVDTGWSVECLLTELCRGDEQEALH